MKKRIVQKSDKTQQKLSTSTHSMENIKNMLAPLGACIFMYAIFYICHEHGKRTFMRVLPSTRAANTANARPHSRVARTMASTAHIIVQPTPRVTYRFVAGSSPAVLPSSGNFTSNCANTGLWSERRTSFKAL